MGVEKEELTIQEAVAREAHILRDSTETSAGSSSSWSTGSSSSGSTGSSSSGSTGSSRRRRRSNVRISVSGWVEDRRLGRRRRSRS